MALFQRGQRTPELPSEVARRLDLGRGERILAASPDETGTWVHGNDIGRRCNVDDGREVGQRVVGRTRIDGRIGSRC